MCSGGGLRYKPGVDQDGRQCAQDFKLTTALEGDVMVVTVTKPGAYSKALKLKAKAEGEISMQTFVVVILERLNVDSNGTRARFDFSKPNQSAVSAFGCTLNGSLQHPLPRLSGIPTWTG